MIGYVNWTSRMEKRLRKQPALREIVVLNMRMLQLQLPRGGRTPEALARRRCRAGARALQRLGVTRAVFEEDFPYLDEFARRGILPVDPLPLLRSLAAPWTQAVMAEKGLSPHRAVIAVAGDRLSGELTRAVTELCLRNRYVQLSVPYGGENLCRELRREYGVSLVLTERKEQLETADVLVLFQPREDLARCNKVVLDLSGRSAGEPVPTLRLPDELEARLPRGCSRVQLFAALTSAGALRPGQIEIVGNRTET